MAAQIIRMGKIQHHLFVRLREPPVAAQFAYAPSIHDTVNHGILENGDILALILVLEVPSSAPSHFSTHFQN